MSPARALLLTPVMPASGGNGLAMRAGLLLDGLARAFDVDVLVVPVFGRGGAPPEFVARRARRIEELDLDPAPDPAAEMIERLRTPAGRLRAAALHPLPGLCVAAGKAAASAVADRCNGAAIVVALRVYLAPFLDALLDRAQRPRIIIDIDEHESVTRVALGQPAEAERFARLERHYLPLADHVFSCAPADVQRLREWLGPRSVSAVPNAIRPPARTVVAPRDGPLLFCGNLSYMPNVEAARWLCERVLPRLPGVHAAIVGRDPGAEVRGLERDPRIVVFGDVPEVGPCYERASLAVVPVLRGGGSRIKLIEAFAHRRAVVSTTAGAAGLPWPVKGSPVVLADAPDTFAGACRALLADPERSDRLAAEGQRLVKANATVAVVAARIERLARAVCGSDAVATT